MAPTIRPCTADDLVRLLAATPSPGEARHHREVYARQEAGAASYLLAWEGERLLGRCTLLYRSKYRTVRAAAGEFPEINALAAQPTGQGTGTLLIAAAESSAEERGAARIGLGVAVDNVGARRLYERLGYREWAGGLIVDRWSELLPRRRWTLGRPRRRRHAERCYYLVKALAG